MERVRLSEIAKIIAGQPAPKDEFLGLSGYPFIRAGHIEGLINGLTESSLPKVEANVAEKLRLRMIPTGTILFAKSGMSAMKNRVYKTSSPTFIVSHLAGVLPSHKYHSDYLGYYLNWYGTSKLVLDDSYPSIRLSDIEKLEIPLPSLENQKKISAILDKADEMRKNGKKILDQYDHLAQSVFLEMFGDTKLNPQKWEIKFIEEICSEIVDCPHSTPKYVDKVTEYPCVRTTELRNGSIDWSSMKYLDAGGYIERTSRLLPEPGDILYGREGSFGEAAIIPLNTKMSLGQRVMLFRPKYEIVNSIYFLALIRSRGLYEQAVLKTSGSTVGHVNIKDIRKFKCPIPPISLQNRFAEIIDNIESQKELSSQSLHKSEELFQSLLQRTFKRELV